MKVFQSPLTLPPQEERAQERITQKGITTDNGARDVAVQGGVVVWFLVGLRRGPDALGADERRGRDQRHGGGGGDACRAGSRRGAGGSAERRRQVEGLFDDDVC